ncbi:MAG TPA: class I SAM-dependent methyltransferase [Acidimicrobiales bacterium]|nr:class I SAM-dependent methyltransferase [Acidimicrobiales bacterium]
MTGQYWRGALEDEGMQDEHGFIWRAMLDMVDVPLSGRRVLDVGCNRGGFLRLLVDHAGIGSGFGYDPAPGAIEDARHLAGTRPLAFEVADTVPEHWSGFDVAFSHEVLYVLHDLASHAAAMFAALAAGGSYFATIGVHADSPLMVGWHGEKAGELDLPGPYRLEQVADIFENVGFNVAVGRLPFRFVPVHAHRSDSHSDATLSSWLDYYYRDKVMFRFTKTDRSP